MHTSIASTDFSQVRRRYADLFGRAAAVYGLSPIFGRLYGSLLLSPQPMTLDQLVEAAGAAKSTVSVAMRQLETYRLVRREWLRRDRRDFFVARFDFAAMLQDWYQLFFQQEIRYAEDANAEVRVSLGVTQPAPGWPSADEKETILLRLDEIDQVIAAFKEWFDEFVNLVESREPEPAEEIPIQVEL